MFRLGRFLIYKINPETALAAKFKVINKKGAQSRGNMHQMNLYRFII